METAFFSEMAERVLENAVYETRVLSEEWTSTDHLLLALLSERDSNAWLTLRDLRNPDAVKKAIQRTPVGNLTPVYRGATPRTERILHIAGEEAKRAQNSVVGSEHLLIALAVEAEGLAGRILTQTFGLTPEILRLAARDRTPERSPKKARMPGDILRPRTHHGTETPMWQRFTERARRLVFFAQEEAGKLGEGYVSTEHLLLGMIRENDSVSSRILQRLGVSLSELHEEILRLVAKGDGQTGGDMQLTPRAKRVIDLAYDEARQLNNNYIGTEHLLLGLIREGEGLAGHVLLQAGADVEKVRHEVMLLQDEAAALVGREAEPAAGGQDKLSGEEPRMTLRDRVRLVLFGLRRTEPQLFARHTAETETALTTRVMEMLDSDAAGPGDLGVAKAADGYRYVEVAMDAETFLHLVAAYAAKDAHGYRAMVNGDQTMFLLPAGTRIKRLIPPPGSDAAREAEGRYIRVLEGAYEGYAGWLFAERFERTGRDAASFPPAME
jgi:ATP-dependent Clp protease ATP-binding subunit ClpA